MSESMRTTTFIDTQDYESSARKALTEGKTVILAGPPACGKSLLFHKILPDYRPDGQWIDGGGGGTGYHMMGQLDSMVASGQVIFVEEFDKIPCLTTHVNALRGKTLCVTTNNLRRCLDYLDYYGATDTRLTPAGYFVIHMARPSVDQVISAMGLDPSKLDGTEPDDIRFIIAKLKMLDNTPATA